MRTCLGASTPSRTLLPSMATTVTMMSPSITICSPQCLVRTSMGKSSLGKKSGWHSKMEGSGVGQTTLHQIGKHLEQEGLEQELGSTHFVEFLFCVRSEERRVGKECRSR